MKVYAVIASPMEAPNDSRLHDKAFDDWNRAVQFLVETFGARWEDVQAHTDSFFHKMWRVETGDFKFQIHQLDLS